MLFLITTDLANMSVPEDFFLLPVLDSGIHGSNDSDSTDSSGKNHASFFLDVLKTLKKNLRRKSRGKYKIA